MSLKYEPSSEPLHISDPKSQTAVVTKNWNMRFKSLWLGGTISINGRELKVNEDYNYGVWNWLDTTTAYLMHGGQFNVWFNDNPAADGSMMTANPKP